MNKKRILIISPDSRHFVQDYIDNVLSSDEYEICFLSINADKNDKTWVDNEVTVYNLKNKQDEPSVITIFFSIIRLLKYRKLIGYVDVIHYHYIDYRFTRLADFFLKNNGSKTILTFWGSDLLRADAKRISRLKYLYKRSSIINVMSQEMLVDFNKKTNDEFKEKTIILDFGNSAIEEIKNKNTFEYKNEAKNKWNIPSDRIVVHVGYNGSRSHQHIKVAQALSKLDEELKNKIYIILPFGYSCLSADYKKEVEEAFYEAGVDYRIEAKYLSLNEIISFRLTADIFLYAQETDAISSSVLEYLSAGTLVLKPKWLDYSELTTLGVKMSEYDSFERLPIELTRIIQTMKDYRSELFQNPEIVVSNKSWESLKNRWLELYS